MFCSGNTRHRDSQVARKIFLAIFFVRDSCLPSSRPFHSVAHAVCHITVWFSLFPSTNIELFTGLCCIEACGSYSMSR